MTSLGAFLLIQILGTALCAQDWAYEEGIDGALGPKEWGEGYKNCKKAKQSPINIVKDDAIESRHITVPNYKDIDEKFSNANLTNNGLYLVLKSEDMSEVTIKSSNDVYTLREIRYHWGKNDSVGSEHMFDGKSYPFAMQLIFCSTNFVSLEESFEYNSRLIIIAVLFEIVSEDYKGISEVVSALESIQEVGKTKTFDNIKSSFKQLLPANREAIYVYSGSLTAPPCTPADWNIYMNPLSISSSQLEKFRQLDAKYGGKLTSNDRPIQPIGKRDVFYKTK